MEVYDLILPPSHLINKELLTGTVPVTNLFLKVKFRTQISYSFNVRLDIRLSSGQFKIQLQIQFQIQFLIQFQIQL